MATPGAITIRRSPSCQSETVKGPVPSPIRRAPDRRPLFRTRPVEAPFGRGARGLSDDFIGTVDMECKGKGFVSGKQRSVDASANSAKMNIEVFRPPRSRKVRYCNPCSGANHQSPSTAATLTTARGWIRKLRFVILIAAFTDSSAEEETRICFVLHQLRVFGKNSIPDWKTRPALRYRRKCAYPVEHRGRSELARHTVETKR